MHTGQLGVTGRIRIGGLILALIVSIGLSAQSRPGKTNTNTATAVLHIRVNVMPTVLAAKTESQPAQQSGISYIIPVVKQQDQTSVQESQLTPQSCAATNCSGVLRTTTVVAY